MCWSNLDINFFFMGSHIRATSKISSVADNNCPINAGMADKRTKCFYSVLSNSALFQFVEI